MKTYAYCVYDRKSLIYNTPFFAVSDGAAVRSFRDLANDLSTTVGRHPGDFVLYRVGTFDDAIGCMLPDTAVHIADAQALVDPKPDLFRNVRRPNGEIEDPHHDLPRGV